MQRRLEMADAPALYLPALDGLRVFAFLLVFLHHAPAQGFSKALGLVQSRGWVGVELFFVISSYLFFHLFGAEFKRTGGILIGNFYIRRMLRIYPLMVAFPVVMFAIYGSSERFGFARIGGIMLFVENVIVAIKGYDLAIPAISHLWTLSFEFQIYLVIPFLFLFFRTTNPRSFLLMIAGVFVFSALLRTVFILSAVPHPAIWVSPFLRPESVLAGIALSVIRPKWDWRLSFMATIVFGALFLLCPIPWVSRVGNVLSYPLAALFCASLVDTCVRGDVIGRVVSIRPLRFLGTISFGLYVFHLFFLQQAQALMGNPEGANSLVNFASVTFGSIAITVAVACLSFFLFERPFLMMKERFTTVVGRPVASAELPPARAVETP